MAISQLLTVVQQNPAAPLHAGLIFSTPQWMVTTDLWVLWVHESFLVMVCLLVKRALEKKMVSWVSKIPNSVEK